jgi:hypothetical protein
MASVALCDNHDHEKDHQKNWTGPPTDQADSSLSVSMKEKNPSFKGYFNAPKYAPDQTDVEINAHISAATPARNTASQEKRSVPAMQRSTVPVLSSHTNATNNSPEDPISSLLSKNEPTVYTGRGLLPRSDFIFLAEVPTPRAGRQSRVDHRAIFAVTSRHAQMARYGPYNPDFGEADTLSGRSKVTAIVPDWAVFSTGTRNTQGGKNKYPVNPRKSGGRVRGWVE